MDRLPFELLDLIARDETTYKKLLAIPHFARTIDPSRRIDFMIKFGHTVKITNKATRWYKNGKRHRLDGPAIEYINGNKFWYKNGKLHRLDGPAIVSRRYKKWYKNGRLHRLDGPAIKCADYKAWYKNGSLHRKDGPSIECTNGNEYWYDDYSE